MTEELPTNIGDREYQKFMLDADGNPAVRVAPGSIKDSDTGNEMDVDDLNRARTYDLSVQDEIRETNDLLREVVYQLKLITGA